MKNNYDTLEETQDTGDLISNKDILNISHMEF